MTEKLDYTPKVILAPGAVADEGLQRMVSMLLGAELRRRGIEERVEFEPADLEMEFGDDDASDVDEDFGLGFAEAEKRVRARDGAGRPRDPRDGDRRVQRRGEGAGLDDRAGAGEDGSAETGGVSDAENRSGDVPRSGDNRGGRRSSRRPRGDD